MIRKARVGKWVPAKRKESKMSEKEILETYLEECDFNDLCDKCDNPNKERTWAKMTGAENEVDFYLCRSCAVEFATKRAIEDGITTDARPQGDGRK